MNMILRTRPHRNMLRMMNEFDRALNGSLRDSRTVWNAPRTWGPALDVVEQDDAFVITAALPGFDPDALEITLEENVLTLAGERIAPEADEDVKVHLREQRYGRFSRSIRFPVDVNGDAVSAAYSNGIITLHVPKAEEVKPKRIEVKVS